MTHWQPSKGLKRCQFLSKIFLEHINERTMILQYILTDQLERRRLKLALVAFAFLATCYSCMRMRSSSMPYPRPIQGVFSQHSSRQPQLPHLVNTFFLTK